MRKLICGFVLSLLTLFTSSAFAYVGGCPSDNTVFFAYTKKGFKAVELCNIGQGKFLYSYGKIGSDGELNLLLNFDQIEVSGNYEGFYFYNGKYMYDISQVTDRETGKTTSSIDIYKGDKHLGSIELKNDDTLVNEMHEYF